jgi:hypothetical protein
MQVNKRLSHNFQLLGSYTFGKVIDDAPNVYYGDSIKLLNLIRVLNLPAAGWHRYKSRRHAIFGKAIQELGGMKTTNGHLIDVHIRQGTNQADFMLVGRLVPIHV